MTAIDLQKKLEGGMKAGRYRVTAAAYELLSNSVAIDLETAAAPIRKLAKTIPQPYIKHTLVKTASLKTKVVVPEKTSMGSRDVIDVAIQIGQEAGVYRTESGEALWTCHLIFVKLDERPGVVPASVPVQEISSPDGRSAFNAVFQIDLNAIVKTGSAGKYQVYMDAGTEVLGPYELDFDVE